MSSAWLRWLFGIDSAPDWASRGRWRIEFDALPRGLFGLAAVAIGAAIVALVWFLYRRESRDLSRRLRITLSLLRLATLGLAAAMLLEMVVVLSGIEQTPSRLIVLADGSESMALTDPYVADSQAAAVAGSLKLTTPDGKPDVAATRGRSRWDLSCDALRQIFPELARERTLHAYRFAEELSPDSKPEALLAQKPGGAATAIGTALAQALDAHRGHPLAGVLLVTDGQSNAGDDPLAIAQAAARIGVPVNVLALGGDQGPRNARVTDLALNEATFVRDPTDITVHMESRGLSGEPATVVLEQRQADGEWSEIGREEVSLGADGALTHTDFRITPDAIGQFEYRARLEVPGTELTQADNIASGTQRVVRQQIRVLMVAGYPFPEFEFLRNALLRDPQIEFSSWLQSADKEYEQAGRKSLRRLPATQAELDDYDVVLLFDPDPKQFEPDWTEMLAKFVGEAGGGLIYVAGERNSGELFNAGSMGAAATSWLSVLPIVREAGLYQSAAEVQLSARETWTLEVTPQGLEDPIFRFAPDPGRNREVLASLPGIYWHFPVTRAKPGATVLARHGDPRMRNQFGRHVVLATHLYGPGRTLFVGFDSTFRWRYLDEQHFDGFWARLVDRVGRGKALGGRHPFTLTTDKAEYRAGDRVAFDVLFNNPDDAAAGGDIKAEIEFAGQPPRDIELESSVEAAGRLRGEFTVDQPGDYIVRVVSGSAAETTAAPKAATLNLRVEAPQAEMDRPTWNRPLMESMARATGGRVFTLENFREIDSAFKTREVDRVLEYREPIWDSPLVYCGLLLGLTLEWVLRKRARLA